MSNGSGGGVGAFFDLRGILNNDLGRTRIGFGFIKDGAKEFNDTSDKGNFVSSIRLIGR